MARSVDHKEGLIKNRCYIVKNLANPDDVAEYLYLEKFFTEEMRDKVQRKREREKKIRKILDELQYRGKRAVKGLHVAFLNTENEEWAEKLAPYVEVLDSEEHKIEPKRWPPSVEEQIQMEQDSVIKVRHVTGIYRHHYNDSDKVYKMKNRLRGKVFVINNVNFKKSGQRLGSDKDAQNIKSLFTELHFDVIRKDNCTKQDMLNFLTEERDKVTWSDMECLILIIMSHGTDKGVLGVDEEVLELKQMTDLFNSDNCPGLNEKPRLVFVQACRGARFNRVPKLVALHFTKDDTSDIVPTKQIIGNAQFFYEQQHKKKIQSIHNGKIKESLIIKFSDNRELLERAITQYMQSSDTEDSCSPPPAKKKKAAVQKTQPKTAMKKDVKKAEKEKKGLASVPAPPHSLDIDTTPALYSLFTTDEVLQAIHNFENSSPSSNSSDNQDDDNTDNQDNADQNDATSDNQPNANLDNANPDNQHNANSDDPTPDNQPYANSNNLDDANQDNQHNANTDNPYDATQDNQPDQGQPKPSRLQTPKKPIEQQNNLSMDCPLTPLLTPTTFRSLINEERTEDQAILPSILSRLSALEQTVNKIWDAVRPWQSVPVITLSEGQTIPDPEPTPDLTTAPSQVTAPQVVVSQPDQAAPPLILDPQPDQAAAPQILDSQLDQAAPQILDPQPDQAAEPQILDPLPDQPAAPQVINPQPNQATEPQAQVPQPDQATEPQAQVPQPDQATEPQAQVPQPDQATEPQDQVPQPDQATEPQAQVLQPDQATEPQAQVPQPDQATEPQDQAPQPDQAAEPHVLVFQPDQAAAPRVIVPQQNQATEPQVLGPLPPPQQTIIYELPTLNPVVPNQARAILQEIHDHNNIEQVPPPTTQPAQKTQTVIVNESFCTVPLATIIDCRPKDIATAVQTSDPAPNVTSLATFPPRILADARVAASDSKIKFAVALFRKVCNLNDTYMKNCNGKTYGKGIVKSKINAEKINAIHQAVEQYYPCPPTENAKAKKAVVKAIDKANWNFASYLTKHFDITNLNLN